MALRRLIQVMLSCLQAPSREESPSRKIEDLENFEVMVKNVRNLDLLVISDNHLESLAHRHVANPKEYWIATGIPETHRHVVNYGYVSKLRNLIYYQRLSVSMILSCPGDARESVQSVGTLSSVTYGHIGNSKATDFREGISTFYKINYFYVKILFFLEISYAL